MRNIVLDTNIVLDLLLFDDPAIATLKLSLEEGSCRWLATAQMRAELDRVLAYPKIEATLQTRATSHGDVLAAFDRLTTMVPAAPLGRIRCTDRDDQMFVDLALAHAAHLLSKDQAVLALRKRLHPFGVAVHRPANAGTLPIASATGSCRG
jgi:putative PIN family toxin of toxin-antitoxin system